MKSTEQQHKKFYKSLGAIHIHTLHSDGTENVEKISKTAKAYGIDWIIITDHNNFDVKEGIINGVTVIKGEEISLDDKNHYLCFGINKCLYPSEDISDNIEEVRSIGGFGFAAHPDERDKRQNSKQAIKWLDKTVIPDGVEIWNWFSQWGDNYNSKNIFTIAYSYFFRHKLVKKPYRETLEWWDKLNNSKEEITPAIGGIDAHALKIRDYIIPVTVFPYKTTFKTIANEIILDKPLKDDFQKRKEQIFNALKKGNNLIINRKTYKKTPEIYIENSNERISCGKNILLDENTYLNFNCDKKVKLKIYKNGNEIFNGITKSQKIKITEIGKYRVEAEINGYGYVYSNPIIVKGENILG